MLRQAQHEDFGLIHILSLSSLDRLGMRRKNHLILSLSKDEDCKEFE